MPDVEAVGEAVSGAAVSRAVEPGHGEADGHTHESACLNCGTPLAGDYCHRCGQKAHVHRTISAWWHDFLHGVLHLDGKFWRTLPMLAWRPGELTRRYIEGERASFVSPMALFLFSVFLMFAVFSATGNKLIGDPGEVQAEIARERSLVASRVDRLETQRRDAAAAGRPTGPIDRELAQARKELDSFEELGEVASSPEPVLSNSLLPMTSTGDSESRVRRFSERVPVTTVSPSSSPPSLRKCRSRCAEITALPGSPGSALPGRWPGPTFSSSSPTPETTISSRPMDGIRSRASGDPAATPPAATVLNAPARAASTDAFTCAASHCSRAASARMAPSAYRVPAKVTRSSPPATSAPPARRNRRLRR